MRNGTVRDIPGVIDDIYQEDLPLGVGKKGEEIPIAGRIVALADVYDALISRRVYKDPWSEEMTLDYIKAQAGKHFDPEVVKAFLAIYDVITAIREKYQDERLPTAPCGQKSCFAAYRDPIRSGPGPAPGPEAGQMS